jgi:hypothetical protein
VSKAAKPPTFWTNDIWAATALSLASQSEEYPEYGDITLSGIRHEGGERIGWGFTPEATARAAFDAYKQRSLFFDVLSTRSAYRNMARMREDSNAADR